MDSTARACKYWVTLLSKPSCSLNRYNGSSDLQLERMNVYFNEVSRVPVEMERLDTREQG